MDSQVGEILRQARNRRKVELSEVETATRIRLRYLQAIEAEEWEVLPGGVYTRGFIRTYASFLGLDGDRLAEDYRASVEGTAPDSAASAPGAAAPPRPNSGLKPGRSRRLGWLVAATGAVLIAAAVIALLPGSDGGGVASRPQHREQGKGADGKSEAQQPARSGVSLQLTASAEVWVCLLSGGGKPLVDGQILAAGAQAGPFHSGSFTVSFGNGEVSMMVDGSEAEIPATSSPVGYSIDPGGTLTELSERERPTCL